MRQFQFTFISGGKTKQVTVDVDIIDAECKHFTIINIDIELVSQYFQHFCDFDIHIFTYRCQSLSNDYFLSYLTYWLFSVTIDITGFCHSNFCIFSHFHMAFSFITFLVILKTSVMVYHSLTRL